MRSSIHPEGDPFTQHPDCIELANDIANDGLTLMKLYSGNVVDVGDDELNSLLVHQREFVVRAPLQ